MKGKLRQFLHSVFMGLVVQQQVKLDLGNRLRGPSTYY